MLQCNDYLITANNIEQFKTPFTWGPDKFLNGQELARIRLLFTRDPRNRASFWTANSTAICNRNCTVLCKRVALIKKSSVQKFCQPHINGRNIVGCYLLRPCAHSFACCCVWLVLLRVVVQSFKPVKLLASCKRTQHCWLTTPNIAGSCWVRLHVA